MKALKSKADLVTGVALIALLLGFSFSSSVSFKHLIMKIIIMGLFALSLNIQSGWGGLRPLGHGLMFGPAGAACGLWGTASCSASALTPMPLPPFGWT